MHAEEMTSTQVVQDRIARVRPELGRILSHVVLDQCVRVSMEYGDDIALLSSDGKPQLYAGYSSSEVISKSENISKLSDPTLVVINGVGLGDHLPYLQKKYFHSHLRFVVVEPDPALFLRAFEKEELHAVLSDQRFEFFVGIPTEFLSAMIHKYLSQWRIFIDTARTQNFYYEPAMRRSGKYFMEFAQIWKSVIEHLLILYKSPGEDGFRGLINIMENKKCFLKGHGIREVKKIAQGMKAVVVAAGPSLDLHLKFLKKNQNRLLVACTDGALQSLLENDITPDFLMSIERVVHVEKLIQDVNRCAGIPLFATPLVYPKFLEKYKGPVFFVSRSDTYGQWLNPDEPNLDLGDNVATMAYRILCELGVDEVALLGQDLSYERNTGRSHAAEMNADLAEHTKFLKSSYMYCTVPANDGTVIDSHVYWRSGINNMNHLISNMGVKCLNVIPIECGAKIEKSDRVDPQEYWDKIADLKIISNDKIDLKNKLQGQSKYYLTEQQFDSRVNSSLDQLKKFRENLLSLELEISKVEHSDLPLYADESLLSRYGSRFEKWDEKIKNLIEDLGACFDQMLMSLVLPAHGQLVLQRNSMDRAQSSPRIYIDNWMLYTHSIFQNLLYWCSRVEFLFQRYQ